MVRNAEADGEGGEEAKPQQKQQQNRHCIPGICSTPRYIVAVVVVIVVVRRSAGISQFCPRSRKAAASIFIKVASERTGELADWIPPQTVRARVFRNRCKSWPEFGMKLMNTLSTREHALDGDDDDDDDQQAA